MRFVLRYVGRVEAIKIPDIETAQHTACGDRKDQMVFGRVFDHRRVKGSLHVSTTGAQCSDERLPHGIFVKVEADRHGAFRGGACGISRSCASASSTAMSPSISSRLAW